MSQVFAILGAQWGDEGKGKWVDILAKKADIVVRYQGGDNAGHTLYIEGKKSVLHLIPSGIFSEQLISVLAAGVVVNPANLFKEISALSEIANPKRLKISVRCHVISPWHIYQDELSESQRDQPIGTTKKGIGPTYMDKASRKGLRLGDYVVAERRSEWRKQMAKAYPLFEKCETEFSEQWAAFEKAAEGIAPFVMDVESYLRQALKDGQKILLEGAQGSLLDIDHGTYPYVTSSSTTTGGAMASLGITPRALGEIWGVTKAYATRVGEGPFPTEDFGQDGKRLAELGHEFGATTGRPRRCGWLDLVALRYAVEVNGCTSLIVNKLDILDTFSEIKVAVAYEHPELGQMDRYPWDTHILKACRPVYKVIKGWQKDSSLLKGSENIFPQLAEFVKIIEDFTECSVQMLGNGVGRDDAVFL